MDPIQVLKRAFSSDAFGVGSFDSEKALDNSRMIQRERERTADGLVDFRRCGGFGSAFVLDTDPTRVVLLHGGPYHGQRALVLQDQRRAWVIGDYEYVDRGDRWEWWYDEMA